MAETSAGQRERFPELYRRWRKRQLTQSQAANRLGMSVRTFRRWAKRYRQEGLKGLPKRRPCSKRQASPKEVSELLFLYREMYGGWSVQHFYEEYRDRHGGRRSHTWVREHLQAAGAVSKAKRYRSSGNGKRPESRPRQARSGALIHQIGKPHRWVAGRCWDLTVMIDDATNRICSGIFAEEPGFWPRLHVVRETADQFGFFDTLGDGRSPDCWYRSRSRAMRKRYQLQFARVMAELETEVISTSAYNVQGWYGRMLRTLTNRLGNEMVSAGVSNIAEANSFLRQYLPRFNARFAIEARDPETAFVGLMPEAKRSLDDTFCVKEAVRIGPGHCVTYMGRSLQIPRQEVERCPLQGEVHVCEYENGNLAMYRRNRRLSDYDCKGRPMVRG